MIIALLAVLLLAAFASYHLISRKLGVVILITAYLAGMVVGCGVLPSLMLSQLQSYPKAKILDWKSSNVIILLGSGLAKWPSGTFSLPAFSYGRAFEAARLYRDCKAQHVVCKIITSGGDPMRVGVSESEILALELVDLGVDQADIILESQSKNTYQNAKFSSPLVKSGSFDFVVLVTSSYHMRRSLILFDSFGIRPLPAPADFINVGLTFLPTALNIAFADIAIHEYLGRAQFYLYNFMGWNAVQKS